MRTFSILASIFSILLISCCSAPDVTASPAPSAVIIDSPHIDDGGVDAFDDAGLEDASIDSSCTCEEELSQDGSADSHP